MNLQEEINELNKRIDAQNKYVKSLMDKLEGVVEGEFPQYSNVYWFINDECEAYCTVYENHSIDRHRQSIGNFFQIKEQAEFAAEKLKVEAELRKFSRPFEKGEYNSYIFFYIDGDYLEVGYKVSTPSQGAIYFESEEKAHQAIESVGEERIKKYIFGEEG